MPANPPTKAVPAPPVRMVGHRRRYWSVAIFVLLISGVLIRAYRDLSRPDAWDYWKDQYVSPSLTSSPRRRRAAAQHDERQAIAGLRPGQQRGRGPEGRLPHEPLRMA